MRHRKRTVKLGRTSAHRKALLRNMVTSLLEHERIETTHAKARQVRRTAERMITLGKRGGLHARRRALRMIRSRQVAAKVFDDLAERYRDRSGGYTRVLKLGNRAGDAASLSVVKLVEGATPGTSTAGGPARATRKSAKRPRSEPASPKGARVEKGGGKKAGKAKPEEKPRTRRKAKAGSAKAEKGEKPKKRSSAGSGKAAKKKKAAKTPKAGRKKTSRKKSG